MIIVDKSKLNPSEIQPSEITSKAVFDNRRQFIKVAASSGLIAGAALMSLKAKAAKIVGGVTSGDARLVGPGNAPSQPFKALKNCLLYTSPSPRDS